MKYLNQLGSHFVPHRVVLIMEDVLMVRHVQYKMLCVRAPYPPAIKCGELTTAASMQLVYFSLTVNPCASVTCPTGSQCEVYKPTGEAFCNPSCDLDNGGCLSYQTCSLQVVQCAHPFKDELVVARD